MSAIFGVYNLNTKPVHPRILDGMSDCLSHRSADEKGIWTEEAIGLGHHMLWTTPESLQEKLPKSIDNGNLAITAAARIDNRDELLTQFNLSGNASSRTVSDSEIIILAYEKWGEECSSKLIGDFAFAIWDRRKRHLFCARDHFGVKPFYYYADSNCFAFATEIKALFSIPGVPCNLNEEMIADYLIGNFDNKSATFYQSVLRLPPAHNLIVSPDAVRLYSYFTLDPNRELILKSDREYAEGLREIFTEAVRCRMRSVKPVGSMLSGGLDSSSIACITRDLLRESGQAKLPTFSLIYDRVKQCDEREYINLVLLQGGFDAHFIPGDNYTPFSHLDTISRQTDGPATGPGHSGLWGIYKAINQAGVRTIFDGHDGDSAISYGYKYLDELAQANSWFALAKEAKELSPVFSMSQWKIIKAYVNQYRWRPFLQKHPRLKRINYLGQKISSRQSTKSWIVSDFEMRSKLINKDFARRVNLADRHKSLRQGLAQTSRTAREEHYRMVNAGRQAFALEEKDAVTAAFGLDMRYPFWDKRLIEYSLSLPAAQKLQNGWNRVVMRRAMNSVLPSSVCWRREKTDFTANFIDGLIRHQQQDKAHQLRIDGNDIFHEFFDKRAMRELYQKINSQDLSSDDTDTRNTARFFWDIASLSSWLHHVPCLN